MCAACVSRNHTRMSRSNRSIQVAINQIAPQSRRARELVGRSVEAKSARTYFSTSGCPTPPLNYCVRRVDESIKGFVVCAVLLNNICIHIHNRPRAGRSLSPSALRAPAKHLKTLRFAHGALNLWKAVATLSMSSVLAPESTDHSARSWSKLEAKASSMRQKSRKVRYVPGPPIWAD